MTGSTDASTTIATSRGSNARSRNGPAGSTGSASAGPVGVGSGAVTVTARPPPRLPVGSAPAGRWIVVARHLPTGRRHPPRLVEDAAIRAGERQRVVGADLAAFELVAPPGRLHDVVAAVVVHGHSTFCSTA